MQPEVTFGKRGLARTHSSPIGNSYSPTVASRSAVANAGPDLGAVDGTDMMLAIGGNWRKYLSVWEKLGAGRTPIASFSWPGLLIGAIWLLYRKQYAAFFIASLASTAIGFVFPAQKIWVGPSVNLLIAIYGKWWIARNTALMVARTRSLGYPEAETLRRIERQGGVSWIAVSAFLVVAILAITALVAVVVAHRLHPR
jgi:hypothetical protein